MPLRERTHLRRSSKPALDLPPPFRLVTLREVGDAFAHAISVAAQEGAGTLVYVGRFDLAEFAVVLEPEEPLKTARRALYAGLAALALLSWVGDRLGSLVGLGDRQAMEMRSRCRWG